MSRFCSILLLACFAASPAGAVGLCHGGDRAAQRATCVVDGDTFWLAGEKVRIADIDTPEIHGGCASEKAKALAARDRLAEMLTAEPFTLRRGRLDRYGRTLAIVANRRGSLGAALIGEGLARRWEGRRKSWCALN